MEPRIKQCVEETAVGMTLHRRLKRRVGAGATALLLAVTIAACGGSDSSSSETTADTTAAQVETTGSGTSGDTGSDNGVADKTVDEILAEAKAAAAGAGAVHVAGTASGATVDLTLVRDRGASGSIEQGGTAFELLTVGDEIYLRGSEEFYRQLGGGSGDAVVRLIGGKWLKVPAGGSGFEGFQAFTDMDRLIGETLRLDAGESVEKGDVEEVDGVEAVPLRARRGTLFVAATGEPYPIKIVGAAGREGEIVFERWNEPVDMTAPEDAIDVAELQRVATG